MKKVLMVLLLMCFVSVLVFSGTEEIDVYRYLYRNSEKNIDQLDILQNMAEAKLTGAGEFYAWALRQLVLRYKNIMSSKDQDATTEKYAADEQAKILAALLGAEKYTPAAADLWFVADVFTDPLARAEALMALGRIRATGYLPHVIRVLDTYNLRPESRLDGERIAFGAIISLEKYQDPSGYLPVFLASVGWYSKRIKDQAAKSLPLIAKDPSPFMLNLLKSGATYENSVKKTALETIEKTTTVGASSKAEVAVAALAEGHRAKGNDVQQRTILAEMRRLALNMLTKYRSDDPSIYSLMELSYTNRDSDIEEKIAAINALGAQRTDEAVTVLSKFLTALNERPSLTNEQDRLIKVIIPALGNTGRPAARLALTQVTRLNYPNGIKNLATEALKKIPG